MTPPPSSSSLLNNNQQTITRQSPSQQDVIKSLVLNHPLKRRLSALETFSLQSSLNNQNNNCCTIIQTSLHADSMDTSVESPQDLKQTKPLEMRKKKMKTPNKTIRKQGYLMFHHYQVCPESHIDRLQMKEPVICILSSKKIQLFTPKLFDNSFYQNQVEQQQQLLQSLSDISNTNQAITNNVIPICDKYSAHLIGTIYLDDRVCLGKVLVDPLSSTTFSVYIEKSNEKTINNDNDTQCVKMHWESCKSPPTDGTSRSENASPSYSPNVDEEMTCTDMKYESITASAIAEDRLVFEATNESETLQWISSIRQVASSLHNENAYILTELLLKIFEYLDEKALADVSLTSRKFNELSNYDFLWFNLYKSRYEKQAYDLSYYKNMLRNISMTSSSKSDQKDDEDAVYGEQVTWKYVHKKRIIYEKTFLPPPTPPEQPSNSATPTTNTAPTAPPPTDQTTTNAATPSSSSTAAVPPPTQNDNQKQDQSNLSQKESQATNNEQTEIKPPTKEEIEKLQKEEDERKKKEEEEKIKNKSTQFLRKANNLFNAADKANNVYKKRMLWMLCMDNYETCLMYNDKNWTAARNWCVSLIRLEKLVHNLKTNEAQLYLAFMLNQCMEKFDVCMKNAPKNDEVLTLWAGTCSDIAIKVADMDLSDRLFRMAHEKFEEALKIKSHIGTYNDYGISYCDWAEKKIRHLKKRLKISTSILKKGAHIHLEVDSGSKSPKTPCNGIGFSSTPLPLSNFFPYCSLLSGFYTSTDLKELTYDEFERERKVIDGYLDESSKLYDKCLNIKPEYFHALNNKGFNEKLKIDLLKVRKHSLKLTREQEMETNIERKRLVDIACDLFRRCIEIKDFVIARNNYGNMLLQESKEELGMDRYQLLEQSIAQYEQAMILEPNNDGCICRCAIAFLMKAEVILNEIKNGERAVTSTIGTPEQVNSNLEYLYERAKVGFKCLKNTSLSHYNLACLNAIFNKKEECKNELMACIDIVSEQKLREDKDFENVREELWFKEIMEKACNKPSVMIGPTNQNLDL